jgi:hypothetical protein
MVSASYCSACLMGEKDVNHISQHLNIFQSNMGDKDQLCNQSRLDALLVKDLIKKYNHLGKLRF